MIVVVLAIGAVAVYELGAGAYRRRFPFREFSYWHDAGFAFGALSLAFVLSPLMDRSADASFSAHMAQHVVLMLIAPPLLLLGAPLLLAAANAPQKTARAFGRVLHWPALRIATSPAAAFLIFVAVLWIAHFSPLYQAALDHEWIHALEHAAFFTSATLFWMWILPLGSLPRPVPHPIRLLLLFLAIPQGAFLAIALEGARGVLYPHYLAMQPVAQVLADQRTAAEIMWIGGGTILFVAFIAVAAEWAARERGAACA